MSRKKWIIFGLALLTPVIVGLAAVYVVYKNQRVLTQMAIEKVNKQFLGELVVDDSYIALFAQFPYVSIDLKGIRFYETKAKDTKPIYEADDVYLGFNVFELLGGMYDVRSIKIEGGHLDVVKHANGDINLLMAKNLDASPEEASEREPLGIELSEFRMADFRVSFVDEEIGRELLVDLNRFKSKIRLTEEDVFVDLETDFLLDVFEEGEPTFFANKAISLNWKLDYKKEEQLLEIFPSSLRLAEALFSVEGKVDIDNDFDTDIKLYGEKPDFSIFAAFAPREIADVLTKYQNEGQIYFLGTIRGKTSNAQMPSIAVEFGCENAYFVNPNVEKRIDNLSFSGFFSNGADRSLKSSELRLQNFHAKPEEGVFQGQLLIRDFEDPYIKVNLHADLDLEFLGQFFEIEGLQRIKGNILLDMDFDELIDMDMPAEQIARLKDGLDSEITLKDLSFTVPGFPYPITGADGHAIMENGQITLDYLKFRAGDSDFEFSGSLSDFPSVFHGRNQPVSMKLRGSSDRIVFPQLLSFDSALMASTDEELTDFEVKLAFETKGNQLVDFDYLPLGTFVVEDFHGKLKDYPHAFHDFDVKIHVDKDKLTVEDFTGEIDASDFHFSGVVNNYAKWFQDVKQGDSYFEFDLNAGLLVVKDLLTYDGKTYLPDDYRDEEIRDLQLKGKLELHYDSLFQSADLYLDKLQGLLKVHPLKLEDFKGRVHFENGNVLVERFGGKMGRSDFEVDLAYFAGENPAFKMRENSFALRAKALDLDALMNYSPSSSEPVSHADTFNIFELPFSDMRFTADIGKLNYHTYWLEDFRADLRTTADHFLYVDTLFMRVADGGLGLKGYFNGSDPEHIYFNSTMRADRLDIDKLMVKFDNFGQDVMINENLHGKVSGTIESNFLVHPDLTPIIEKSEAKMDLAVYDGSLVNFTPLEAVSSYFKDRNLRMVRFDTLQNTFNLKDGVLHIPKMNINSSLGFIELSGRQSLDLNMDYFIRIPLGLVTQVGFRSLFGGKNRTEVDPDQEDAIVYRDENRRVRFVNLNVSGNPDNYNVSLGKDKEK